MASDTFVFLPADNPLYTNGYSFAVAPPYVIVEVGALVTRSGAAGNALELLGGGYDLTVHGSLVQGADTEAALYVDGAGAASTVTIGATGVLSNGYAGIRADNDLTLDNAGQITAEEIAFYATGAGDFNVTNSGIISAGLGGVWRLFDGSTTFYNSGTVTANTAYGGGWTGVDDITNSETGVINGFIATGGDDDILVNNGTINTMIIDLGDGNDTYINNGTTTKFAGILPGVGDDVVIAGSGNNRVIDGDGSDDYTLGAGSDVYTAFFEGLQNGTDIVRAGENDDLGVNFYYGDFFYGDTYEAELGLNDLLINIGVNDYGDLVGRTASGTDVGFDRVYGFESIFSGEGDDILAGNARQNYISAQGGNDELAGRSGDDVLEGGLGKDLLLGGQGADTLDGGGGADIFEFRSVNASTIESTGRDTVQSFDDGQDQLHFAFLHGSVDYIGKDKAFSGDGTTEIGIRTLDQGWLIRVDANGDGTVDATVKVLDAVHLVTWSVGNFLLD